MSIFVNITERGQIVIPSKIRKQFGIKVGMKIGVEAVPEMNTILLKPVTPEYVRGLRGKHKIKGKSILKSLKADREFEKNR